MNTIEFFKKWIEGIKNITPAQQLHAKMMGHLGAVVGAILATITMIYQGYWYWSVFMFFVIFLQVLEYIGVRQQYIEICKIMDIQSKAMEGL